MERERALLFGHNVIIFAAHAIQLIWQRIPCQASHIERMQFLEKIIDGLQLIGKARLRFTAIDLIVHIQYIDTFVHDANMIVMIIRKEIQFGAQFFGDQRINLIDFNKKYDNIGA